MSIQLGDMTVERLTRSNPDGTKTPYRRICISLSNDGAEPVRRKVTFYRVLVPTGGAMPSAPAPIGVLCSAGPKDVPPRRRVVKPRLTAEYNGTETFCCEVDGQENRSGSEFGQLVIWAEVGAPPKQNRPISFGRGDNHKVLELQ